LTPENETLARSLLKHLRDEVTCVASVCAVLARDEPVSNVTLEAMLDRGLRLIETTYRIEHEVLFPKRKK